MAQSRKRFIVKATKDSKPGLPPKQKRVGWYETIEKLIPQLAPSELLPAQQTVLKEKLSSTPGIKAQLLKGSPCLASKRFVGLGSIATRSRKRERTLAFLRSCPSTGSRPVAEVAYFHRNQFCLQ
ncbi:MAG: hypothetical protein AB1589_33130 [Cyanobacteriota bacterium]